MENENVSQRVIPLSGSSGKISVFIKRYFYSLLGGLALVIVIAGFFKSYIQPMTAGEYKGRLALHIHGAIFMLWMLLGIIQPLLVEKHKTKIHRKLGVYGFILGGIMVFVGLYIGISSAKIHLANGETQAKAFLLTPISDMILFGTFIVLSILNLKNTQAHKRLIILATLSVLPAATGRIFSLFTWWTNNYVIDISIALLMMEITLYLAILYDAIVIKKVHRVYIWGGLAVILVHAFREPLGKTDAWLAMATWITGA